MTPKRHKHVAGQPLAGADLLGYVRERTDTVLLSFSAGKDAIAAWLALREHFRVVPVYYYLVPGLKFVEAQLEYYERFFGTHIIRLPNPAFYRMMGAYTFQPPERWPAIQAAGLSEYTFDELFQVVLEDWRLPLTTWVATGVRAADSPNRRATIMKYGPLNEKRAPPVFYPVWDWDKDRLMHEVRASGVKLSADYRIFGRSFDGIDLRFLYPLAQHHPDDYRRILDFFPLADLELFRFECALRADGKPERADELRDLRERARTGVSA